MYQPEKYKNDSPDFIYTFIQRYPFATIIMQGKHLLATHVPVLIKGSANDFILFGHIANHNPLKKYLLDNQEMLLVFKGPDGYVSPRWYTEPEIPTWDYTAVHINARIQLQTAAELQTSLTQLIEHSERDKNDPFNYREIPTSIWKENFKEITGFWLHPFKVAGIEKLHQGFHKKDLHNIANNLENSSGCPGHNIGELLRKKHGLSN